MDLLRSNVGKHYPMYVFRNFYGRIQVVSDLGILNPQMTYLSPKHCLNVLMGSSLILHRKSDLQMSINLLYSITPSDALIQTLRHGV